MASAIMLLPRRLAAAIVAAIVAGTDLAVVRTLSGQPVGTLIYWICYETATYLLLCAALYGSTRLVRLVDELQATRAELAELAIGRERLRVSRDLHDLLGQSL